MASRSISSAVAALRLAAASAMPRSRASRSARPAAARASSAIRRSAAARAASAADALRDGVGQGGAPVSHPLGQGGFLFAQRGGLPVKLLRVAPGPLWLRVGGQQAGALSGEAADGAGPLGQ